MRDIATIIIGGGSKDYGSKDYGQLATSIVKNWSEKK